MNGAIFELIESALDSPWGLLALAAVAAVDGFFPVVPSESLVVTAGVFAASGDQNLALVITAAALGAFTGDHVSYVVGRRAGDRLTSRLGDGTRRAAAYAWAARVLAERGATVIVVGRYVPGGRTAVTLTAGAVGHPLASFSLFDGIAAASWATYATLVGYLGGAAFEDDPLKGVILGLGLALSVAGAIELLRHAHARPFVAAARARLRSSLLAPSRPDCVGLRCDAPSHESGSSWATRSVPTPYARTACTRARI
jgi:membrane protein DedA with SNARE-associated domain